MGWFKKDTVDEYKNLDIFWLRRQGLLRGYCNTGINWNNHWGKSSIGIIIEIGPENTGYIRMMYTLKHNDDAENLDYKVMLSPTNCNYGGRRWWFTCPNKNCGKRVAKLYLYNKYFVCRKCADLTYETCQKSGSNFLLGKIFNLEEKFEKLYAKTKMFYRKNKITKNAEKISHIKQRLNSLYGESKKWINRVKCVII